MNTPHRHVTVESLDGLQSRITNAGGHTLLADEPTAIGGKGEGFGPFELLAGALGACTSATLKLYAARKEWPLEQVTVAITWLRPGEEGGLPDKDRVTRTIRLTGALDGEQRARLLQIAGRCPVARTLAPGGQGERIVIEDTLAND